MYARNPAFLEMFNKDYVAHFPGGVDVQGPEDVKNLTDQYFKAFPDMTHVSSDFIAQGDKVVVRYRDTGTHKGAFMGVDPTGRKIENTAIGIFRIIDGKMVEGWLEYDQLGLMMQLGMEFKPREEK